MPSSACHVSPYAGSWYPGETGALEALLDRIWEASRRRVRQPFAPGSAAFVVPHAGLQYSGGVAAAAYRHIADEPPHRVVILGFVHRGSPAGAWIPDIAAYRTPLGETPVDRQAVDELVATGAFRRTREEALCDHSVEIQLPLLARAAPHAAVVPVYVSSLSESARPLAAKALAELARSGAMLLASSDFTHYGDAFGYRPFPPDRAAKERLRALDESYIDAASSLDSGLFAGALDAKSATVCGRQPIGLLLDTLGALPGGDDIFQHELDYETSADITGDFGHSVSYAALGYYRWQALRLSDADARLLLDSARATLRRYQETARAEPVPPAGTTPALERPGAAFVSLRAKGDLRGCVGRLQFDEPLARVVPEMTLAAALDDRRFEPLSPQEHDVEIEISILSPMKRLAGPDRVRVPGDGVYLRLGERSGLLLPQVAESRGWGAEEFLDAVAAKAGLRKEASRQSDAQLYSFRTQVIQ